MKAHRDDRERVKRLQSYRYAASRLNALGITGGDAEIVKNYLVNVAVTWGQSVRGETRREAKVEAT